MTQEMFDGVLYVRLRLRRSMTVCGRCGKRCIRTIAGDIAPNEPATCGRCLVAARFPPKARMNNVWKKAERWRSEMFGWTWVILAAAAIVILAAHVLAFALCRAAHDALDDQ